MTQTIKQLQAKIAELEEEIERLRADNIAFARNLKGKSATTGATYEHICTQLAAAQKEIEQLNGQISVYRLSFVELERQRDVEMTSATRWATGYHELRDQLAAAREENKLIMMNLTQCGEQLAISQLRETQLRKALEAVIKVHGYESGIPVEAISTQASTEALDAYVAEKVKEAGKFDVWKTNPYTKVLETSIEQLTKQRDLAVEALEDVRKELQQSNDRLNEEREIWDRVMGDGVKKLERLELELDDCLYVLESLWDKTCNKEVTEKWAGILIRNKRGIGASSAEDSSEQTTA
jgi:chromosome segregation ATPase